MELLTMLGVKKMAIQSKWEVIPSLSGNKIFTLIKTSGTGQIRLNVTESWVDIESNDYFKEKIKEEKNNKELRT